MNWYLSLDTGMLNKHTGISSQATASTPNMSVNLKYFLNALGHHQRRRDALLHGKENTILGLDANGSGSKLISGKLIRREE